MLSPRQFAPQGDQTAREALIDQLSSSFSPQHLQWLSDPQVTVQAPQRVPAEAIDWEDYPNWRASHELKKVQKIAKKLDKKKGKPSVVAHRPGDRELFIIDGHHHALARVEREEDPFAYVVHVPERNGPWNTMHDHQKGDKDKPDFRGEKDRDRD
jgi:hypothetical protein